MYAYHVVTDKPMYVGQQIIFDEEHHSGVFQRVQDKIDVVYDIYSNPWKFFVEIGRPTYHIVKIEIEEN